AAFAVAIDANSGFVSTAQYASLKHPTGSTPDTSEAVSIANTALQAAGEGTAGDRHKAGSSGKNAEQGEILDGGPRIGPIADSTVNFAANATGTATKSLLGAVGADQNAAPYTIVQFNSPITFGPTGNTTTLQGVLSTDKETLTYNGAGADGTFGTADDVPFYRLTLNETANSGAGSYTF